MMPFLLSERLPLPDLKSYSAISLAIFVASILHCKDELTSFSGFTKLMLNEPLCLWPTVNMGYCCLVLIGKLIQIIVLGDLRTMEKQNLQDKFWNFIFYKIIFVFGVVNVSSLHEALCWSAWFSILGFCHMIRQMCKDRYEYITSSPVTPMNKHIKLYSLILCVFISSLILSVFVVAFHYHYDVGISIFAFMMTECIILGLQLLLLLVRYAVKLADFSKSGVWDAKAKLVYYTDFGLEMLIFIVTLFYHIHMLIWSNVFLSMASLVLYWNIRAIFMDMGRKLYSHKLFKRILKSVTIKFPLATREELDALNDHCAICWDTMETARKLPCGHFFHHTCLCSWLLQDSSCPTCRCSLATDVGISRPQHREAEQLQMNSMNNELVQGGENIDEDDNSRNFFFYLNGQRIANWLPSLSIEVFHGRMQDNEQELDNMAQQLTVMFPNIARETIVQNLRQTRSVDATAENILEGHLSNSPVSDEALPATVNDEKPSSGRESISSSQSSLVALTAPEQASDCESNVEESSGTDQQSDIERKHSTGRRHRISHVRSRFNAKTKNLTPSTDISLESFHHQAPPILRAQVESSTLSFAARTGDRIEQTEDLDERRQVLLEAIEKRQNTSKQAPS